ncbi:kinase-like domain-containing protein [Rhizophagus clarus]|uniref:Kinase-like domain-containing protein n=1 Tax=Rhizophagus clarus TaxID=94130 RepID=A0A8H3QXR8_9GLOM|nr:kinase-like domain-containing protein [Rhizophagus clarus]
MTDEFLNETTVLYDSYGISQNPNTKEYILMKKQLKMSNNSSVTFEWVPYSEFIDIRELEDNCLTTAIWKEGPLYFDVDKMKWMRTTYEKVCLKYLSQDDTNEFINEDESSLTNEIGFGISQNPDTNDYILVFKNDYFDMRCEKCDNKYENRRHKWFLLKYLSNSQNINKKFLSEIIYLIEKSYGISQDPNTKDYILILQLKYYCEQCGKQYDNKFEINTKSCFSCQISHEDKKINDLIQEMRLNIDHNSNESGIIFEWIPYDQFNDIKGIGKGGFSAVYSAIWKDGSLCYAIVGFHYEWRREPNKKVALKCLHNSQNFLDEFINKVKAYPNQKIDNILKLYGISQNPDTKDYIMVLEYAEGGNFNNYLDKNYDNFDWFNGLKVLKDIFKGLSKIHQKHKVHCDFHMGNILFTSTRDACISDMGLCKKIDDNNKTNIYGVIPYVSPEVLKGKPYTQPADIYSSGMIMYVIATGRQPFADFAHDEALVLNIYNGIRPEISEKLVPKCYIDLMKRCWDSNPNNRPNSVEIKEMIELFYNSLDQKFKKKQQHCEIEKQFKETQEYRKENFLSLKNNKSTIHAQAIYTSRLLNPFIKVIEQ